MASENYTFLTVCVIVIVCILTSNLYINAILIFKSKLKTSKSVMILSLSFADICVGLFIIPNVIALQLTSENWTNVLCKSCLYLEHVTTTSGAFTIALMAIHRLKAVIFPIRYKSITHTKIVAAVFFIWVCSMVYGLRAPLIFGVIEMVIQNGNETMMKSKCTVYEERMTAHRALIVVDFFMIFFVPCVILVACNVAISLKLQRMTGPRSTVTHHMERRKRIIRLLLVMVALYVSLHLPISAMRLHLLVVDNPPAIMFTLKIAFLVVSWLNSILNVFFYGSLSEDVKVITYRILGRICCQCSFVQVAPTDCQTNIIQPGMKTDYVKKETKC